MQKAAKELCDLLLKAHSQVRPEKGDRYAYVVALKSIASFLRAAEHKDCAEWIERLATQLQDAEITGHVGPDLSPAKKPGNTPRLLDQQLRQFVAAGVKLLIESGAPRKEAAKAGNQESRRHQGAAHDNNPVLDGRTWKEAASGRKPASVFGEAIFGEPGARERGQGGNDVFGLP